MNVVIIGIGLTLLLLLLLADKKEHLTGVFITKLPLSLLFVATAWLRAGTGDTYSHLILIGLSLSMAGDAFLIFSSRAMFLSGLVAFLIAHIFYAFAFYTHASVSAWTWVGLASMAVIGTGIFRWLRPFLGKMKGPVLAYIVVISAMVGGAVSVFAAPGIAAYESRLVFTGAVVFFLSDILVARQQFVKPGFINRAIGLPLYYLGQFMFAFSI
jgi:uncharacterized membrane protein YhhN